MSDMEPAALSSHEPSTCPWCQLAKKVYVRAGSELVCTDCVKKDAAMDATWNEGGD